MNSPVRWTSNTSTSRGVKFNFFSKFVQKKIRNWSRTLTDCRHGIKCADSVHQLFISKFQTVGWQSEWKKITDLSLVIFTNWRLRREDDTSFQSLECVNKMWTFLFGKSRGETSPGGGNFSLFFNKKKRKWPSRHTKSPALIEWIFVKKLKETAAVPAGGENESPRFPLFSGKISMKMEIGRSKVPLVAIFSELKFV